MQADAALLRRCDLPINESAELTQRALYFIYYSEAVFRIHDILVWIRIRESMPLTNEDPDPSIFITDLQDADKKLI